MEMVFVLLYVYKKVDAATSTKTARTGGISQYYLSQKRAHGRYRPAKPDKADYLFHVPCSSYIEM
jgi:hypothetical protein